MLVIIAPQNLGMLQKGGIKNKIIKVFLNKFIKEKHGNIVSGLINFETFCLDGQRRG
jgi:hypothetical protein